MDTRMEEALEVGEDSLLQNGEIMGHLGMVSLEALSRSLETEFC